MTDKKVVQQLPQLKGKSESAVRKVLTKFGFEQTKVTNTPGRNETWKHDDDSQVLIHPYGGETRVRYRSGNNAHIHKKYVDSTNSNAKIEYNDRGIGTKDKSEHHIGIKNPFDLPSVRGRPHGDGEI